MAASLDVRLQRLAILKAVAHHDAQGLHSLLFTVSDESAGLLIDLAVALDERWSHRFAPAAVDSDAGREEWRQLLDRVHVYELARLFMEADATGGTRPDQA